jgi:hypothetical protein
MPLSAPLAPPRIPPAFRADCEFCPEPVDTRTEGTHQYTSGWVMLRQGGGGHGISLPRRHRRWAHRHCIEREIRGSQRSLSL